MALLLELGNQELWPFNGALVGVVTAVSADWVHRNPNILDKNPENYVVLD